MDAKSTAEAAGRPKKHQTEPEDDQTKGGANEAAAGEEKGAASMTSLPRSMTVKRTPPTADKEVSPKEFPDIPVVEWSQLKTDTAHESVCKFGSIVPAIHKDKGTDEVLVRHLLENNMKKRWRSKLKEINAFFVQDIKLQHHLVHPNLAQVCGVILSPFCSLLPSMEFHLDYLLPELEFEDESPSRCLTLSDFVNTIQSYGLCDKMPTDLMTSIQVQIAADVGNAVAFLHSQNVRSCINPDSILVSNIHEVDGHIICKLTDYGVAYNEVTKLLNKTNISNEEDFRLTDIRTFGILVKYVQLVEEYRNQDWEEMVADGSSAEKTDTLQQHAHSDQRDNPLENIRRLCGSADENTRMQDIVAQLVMLTSVRIQTNVCCEAIKRCSEISQAKLVEVKKKSTKSWTDVATQVDIQQPYRTTILPFCKSLPPESGSMPKMKLPTVESHVMEKTKFRWRTLITKESDITPVGSANIPRTILMMGATEAGKSTMIDGIVNYVLGVEFTEDYRFTIIDPKEDEKTRVGNEAVSQTSWITVYRIPQVAGSKMNCELRIMDMPGFCDTAGIEKDKELVDRLRKILSAPASDGGIVELDMVCFVIQSSQNRLNAAQKYMMHSLELIFDKSIQENIAPLITFADGKTPTVLKSLEESGIPCKEYFVFNNSSLFAMNNSNASFVKSFWDLGQESFDKTLTCLLNKRTKNLQLTQEVLRSRYEIGMEVQRLNRAVNEGLGQLDVLMQERAILEQKQNQADGNKNFRYQVSVPKYEKRQLSAGQHVTNCLICSRTCHFPCGIPDDGNKYKCSAMNRKGENSTCTQCPKACSWRDHKNDGHEFVVTEIKIQRTYEEMKKKYEDALQGSTKTEDVVKALGQDFMQTQDNVAQMMKHVEDLSNRLSAVDMSFRQVSQAEYLQMMIDTENHEQRPGYNKRIQLLNDAVAEYKLVNDLETDQFNPWGKYMAIPSVMFVLPPRNQNVRTFNPITSVKKFVDKADSRCDWQS